MIIYLDNAATSWPKDPVLLQAMKGYLDTAGGNPGRSGHRLSTAAARVVFAARENLARLFHAQAAEQIIFTKNATEAINVILFGLLQPGDHVITTSVEHNAVMRPLRHLERSGVILSVIPCDSAGRLDPEDVRRALRSNTKLIIMTHASNVSGAILPIRDVGRMARKAGILFAVDASQTAGSEPIDMRADCIDLLAFTGHKGLGGPQGTGGLAIRTEVSLPPLLFGGTGSLSAYEEQPAFLPDQLESGTLNAIGIAGLGAATAKILDIGVETIRQEKHNLVAMLLRGLAQIHGITVYGPRNAVENTGVVSINLANWVCSEVGMILDQGFGILTRTGLHCAPAAHKTLGTFPQGTVRFSVSRFTTRDEIVKTLQALAQIAQGGL